MSKLIDLALQRKEKELQGPPALFGGGPTLLLHTRTHTHIFSKAQALICTSAPIHKQTMNYTHAHSHTLAMFS